MAALPRGLSPKYWSVWSSRDRSVSEALEPGETWIGGWEGVGLYEGNNKVPDYQILSIHLTTHRLILVIDPPPSGPAPSAPNLQVQLRHVRQTEFYTGFMRSSAKITMSLGRSPLAVDTANIGPDEGSWTCGVCGYVNAEMGADGMRKSKCGLCGVGYEVGKNMSSATTSRVPTPTPRTPIRTSLDRPADGGGQATINGSSKEIACPACTFLNHPSLGFCEICSTALPKRHSGVPSTIAASSAPAREAAVNDDTWDTVRLSFRKGGEKEAYRRLKNVLSDKAWERAQSQANSRMERATSPGITGSDTPRAGAGIDGILQSMSLESKVQDDHMKDAFKDLEVLMVRAGEMVKMAQSLNAKLSTSGGATDEEATLIRSSLVQLGLAAPAITQDMVRDEQKYTEGLAKELGQLLTGYTGFAQGTDRQRGLMVGPESRGIIGLDEIWGLWMRARGVALLPPSTLMAILPILPKHTIPPINVLVLPSSLRVLHTPSYAPSAVLARITSRLAPSSDVNPQQTQEGGAEKSFSLIEISAHENIPIGLTKELMESIEQLEVPPGVKDPVGLVRDDQAVGDGGVRWYRDIISGWEL